MVAWSIGDQTMKESGWERRLRERHNLSSHEELAAMVAERDEKVSKSESLDTVTAKFCDALDPIARELGRLFGRTEQQKAELALVARSKIGLLFWGRPLDPDKPV